MVPGPGRHPRRARATPQPGGARTHGVVEGGDDLEVRARQQLLDGGVLGVQERREAVDHGHAVPLAQDLAQLGEVLGEALVGPSGRRRLANGHGDREPPAALPRQARVVGGDHPVGGHLPQPGGGGRRRRVGRPGAARAGEVPPGRGVVGHHHAAGHQCRHGQARRHPAQPPATGLAVRARPGPGLGQHPRRGPEAGHAGHHHDHERRDDRGEQALADGDHPIEQRVGGHEGDDVSDRGGGHQQEPGPPLGHARPGLPGPTVGPGSGARCAAVRRVGNRSRRRGPLPGDDLGARPRRAERPAPPAEDGEADGGRHGRGQHHPQDRRRLGGHHPLHDAGGGQLPLGPVRRVPGQRAHAHAGLPAHPPRPRQRGRQGGCPPAEGPHRPTAGCPRAEDQLAEHDGAEDGDPDEARQGRGAAQGEGRRQPGTPAPGQASGGTPQGSHGQRQVGQLRGHQHRQQGEVGLDEDEGAGRGGGHGRHPPGPSGRRPVGRRAPGGGHGQAGGQPGGEAHGAGQAQGAHGPGRGGRLGAGHGGQAQDQRVQGRPLDEGDLAVEGRGLGGGERVDGGHEGAGEALALGQVGGGTEVRHAVGGGARTLAGPGHDQGDREEGQHHQEQAHGPGGAAGVHEHRTVPPRSPGPRERRPGGAAGVHEHRTVPPRSPGPREGRRRRAGRGRRRRLPPIGVGGMVQPWPPPLPSSASTCPSRA